MPDFDTNIIVKINGKVFDGWKSLEISQGLEQLCGSFAIKYSDRYINRPADHSFVTGDSCTIEINGHRLITGYTEEIESTYDGENHELQVRGRDKLGDLVDCCHWYSGYKPEFINQSVKNIIKKICSKFNISVVIDSSAESACNNKMGNEDNPFRINEGDTIVDTLIRLCRINAILPVTYGDGKLYLTRNKSEKSNTQLKLGVNIKGSKLLISDIDRFSNYVVKSTDTEDQTEIEGKATDTLIDRHRPIVILAEEIINNAFAKTRAEWESVVRASRSRKMEYQVQGWLQENGEPWRINQLVKIYDPLHGLTQNNNMLCNRISFSTAGNSSTMTTMFFVHPDAYKLETKPEKIKNKKFDLSILTK